MTSGERAMIERTPRGVFDSRQGIKKVIGNKEGKELEAVLRQVSYLRQLYKELTGETLFEFVVDGIYWIPYDGGLHRFAENIPEDDRLRGVIIFDDFKKISQLPDDFVTEEV